jgi:hypothetical protein
MGTHGHLRTYGRNPIPDQPILARQPPTGTIAQGELKPDPVSVQKLPFPFTRELLNRGRERYNIYCSPCHDYTGNGQGMIVQRGFLAPPSFHIDRLRSAPDGHFFDVISRGSGAMYSYGDRIEAKDRWAIVAYIRALQQSQNQKLQTLPIQEQQRLQEMSP